MIVRNYLNYIGSKDRYLPQILSLLETGATKTGGASLIDLCCGSAVVGLNAAKYFRRVKCIDACKELILIHKYVQDSKSSDELLANVDKVIKQFDLSKENKEGFLKLRNHYNNVVTCTGHILPVVLYGLIMHSFNYSLHINKKGEYNAPFGKNRSSFNSSIRKKLINWKEELDKRPGVEFICKDFKGILPTTKSVIFVDPPYSASLSKHPYRVGNISWKEEEDRKLFDLLDFLDESGHLFVFTNVTSNNGVTNLPLVNWIHEHNYKCTPINVNYNNCNYQRKNNGSTVEVIISNFE